MPCTGIPLTRSTGATVAIDRLAGAQDQSVPRNLRDRVRMLSLPPQADITEALQRKDGGASTADNSRQTRPGLPEAAPKLMVEGPAHWPEFYSN